MFKVGKRRNEKFKVVFKLQFHATQVANPGTKLMVSLIPEDVGRPTVRLGKEVIGEDGNCKWQDPVYETLKLTREIKSGKIEDRFYHFVVATGSSKKGFLGEILFNFADFVEAVAPVTVWQPINGSNTNAALHVTVQNMQGGEDARESEENGGLAVESQHSRLRSQLSNSTTDRNSDHDSIEEDYWNTILFQDDEKSRTNINGQTSLKSQSDQTSALDHERNSSINSRQDMGIYLESSSSEPSPSWNSLSQRKIPNITRENSNGDGTSVDGMFSLARNLENKVPSKRQMLSDASPDHLKKEVLSLERQVEIMDLELQTLRRQVVKENKRGQDLVRQVSSLKEEKEVLRAECEKKSARKNEVGNRGEASPKKETDGEGSKDEQEGVEEELAHFKNVNKMLRRQLGKTQDSNSELILVVRDLEERLDKKEKDLAQLSSQFRKSKKSEEHQFENRDSHYRKGIQESQGVAGEIIGNGSQSEEVKLLKEKIMNLEDELESQTEEKKDLQEKMSQILQDYEISKQRNLDTYTKFEDARRQVVEKENQCNCYLRAVEELESEITKMERVMETQAEQFSESSDIVNRLETQIKNLEIKLQSKNQEYEDNLREIMNAKIEHEQRALQAEEDLRKATMNHSAVAQRVQEEFQNLSTELASKFHEHEKLTEQAQTEANVLRIQVKSLEEQLIAANEDIRLMKDDYDIEVEKLSEQLMEKDKQLEQLLVKLQEECKVIESAKKKHESKSNTLSKENEALRVEMERLTEENYHLTKQSEETKTLIAELEAAKSSMVKTKTLFEAAKNEKEELEKRYTSLSMEAQESVDELTDLKSSYEKKNAMIEIFQSELQQLRAQREEFKNYLSEEKLQTAKLKKQVVQQNEDLYKKDQEIAHMQDKYKYSKESNISKEKVKQQKIARSTGSSVENAGKVEEKRYSGRKLQTEGVPSQNGALRGLGKGRKDQKVSDVQSEGEVDQMRLLLAEVAELKEKNTSRESELKEMQDKYSEVSLRFAEVEGERQQLVMTVRNLRNAQKK